MSNFNYQGPSDTGGLAPGVWANYQDQAKLDTPLTLASGVRTQLTIDGLGAITNEVYAQDLWTGNAIRPTVVGGTYMVRVDLTAERLTAGSDELLVEIDIGDGSSIVVAAQTISVTVGGAQRYSFPFPLFALETFVANGGKVFVTPTGGDFELSGAAIFIASVAGS